MKATHNLLPFLSFCLAAGWIAACSISPPPAQPVTASPTPFLTNSQPTATQSPPDPITHTIEVEPTAAGPAPSPTATAAGPCQIVEGSASALAYTRPNLASDPFGDLSIAGYPIPVLARTADGWLGFDPGVAQAGNIGIFRNRWASPDQVVVEGDCENIPVVESIPAGICFTMITASTDVYARPVEGASVLTTLPIEDYARVIGFSEKFWVFIDLGTDTEKNNGTGWIRPEQANLNGPCGSLPGISP